MDFLPGGATNKKAVSLGGRRKETKSREALLQEAKIKREQRNAAAAPAKASTAIQRHVRGLFTRRRLSAQFSTAAEGALSAAAANASPTTLLAAARKLGLLWATGCGDKRPPQAAARLAGAYAKSYAILTRQQGAGWEVRDTGWLRRHARLLPALLHAAAHGHADAASVALGLCLPHPANSTSRELLVGAADKIIRTLANQLLPDAAAASSSSISAEAATSIATLARALLEDAPASLLNTFVEHLPPDALLLRPPPPPTRAALQVVYGRLSGTTRRGLEHSFAMSLGRRPFEAEAKGQLQTASALCFDALIACVEGAGSDWRRGGWEEGKPRRLGNEELGALMGAQVQRTMSLAANAVAGAAAGGAATSHNPAATMSEGALLLNLMRSQWDLTKTVQQTAFEASGTAGAGGAPSSEAAASAGDDDDATMAEALGIAETVAAADAPASEELEVLQPMEISDECQPCGSASTCQICFDEPEPPATLRSLKCGHGFCDDCWGSMLCVALERGPACIHDKCPQPECEEVITGDVWSATLPPEGLAKLQQAALRSFVEWNSLLAYCPTASCGLAAAHTQQRAPPELLGCGCGASFCVLCGEPPHWPLSCSRRKRWTSLLNQSPDAKMIISLTRPCPSCGVRTQRAHGCMHISCTQCNAEWCWGCGMKGKRGEVHHVSECQRKADPTWAYEAEERKALDGTLLEVVDEWTYRREQMDLVAKASQPSAAELAKELAQAQVEAGSSTSGRQSARGPSSAPLTPSALRGTLLRALMVLRWMAVYRYFGTAELAELPPRARFALAQLASNTDALFEACGFGGEIKWAELASAEAVSRRSWLVCSLLYLATHMPAGPPERATEPWREF